MFKLLKNNLINLFFIAPVFIIPFLQFDKLLDISLHIRFLFINIFILIFLIIAFSRFKAVEYTLFFKLNLIYIIYLIINVIYKNHSADAIYHLLLVFSLASLIFLYKLYFENSQLKIENLTDIFSVLALFVVLYAFYDYIKIFTKHGITHQRIYEITASFSHKNILSEVLFIVFPFSLYSLISSSKKLFRFIGIINCIAILFLIIVLITRAVWISFVLGFLITLISFFVFSKKEYSIALFKKKLTYLYLFSAIIIVLISLFIYSKTDNFDTIKKSTVKIFSAYDSSQHRVELWKRSLNMFKENPVIGSGLGSWRIEILKYGNKNLQSTDNTTFYQRPHNDYLWILTEQGLIGFLFYISIIVLIFIYLIRLIRNSTKTQEQIFYWLIYYLLIGYLIFSFFSFPKERIEHNLFLALIFAFILFKYSELKYLKKTNILNQFQIKVIISILVLLSVFSNIFAFVRFSSEMHLKSAFNARINSDWKSVIKEIENAESFAYQIDPFSTPLRWYSGEAYFNLGNKDKAFADFLQSYKLNPFHIHVLNNLATSYEISGNHKVAIDLYKKAIGISPNFEDAILNISAVYYNLATYDSALTYISKIDTSSINPKYKVFLMAILNKKIEYIIKDVENENVVNVLEAIRKNNEWIFNIFVKSKSNCIIFDKQLLKDCLYVLSISELKTDSPEYRNLYSKYIDN